MTDPAAARSTRRESVTKDERLEVLRLLESGAITADDASRLLDALDRSERPPRFPADDLTEPIGPSARRVRIEVTDAAGGSVNLALPATLIDAGLQLARRVAGDRIGDAATIQRAVLSGARGPIIEVHGEDGSHVEIVVE